MKLSLAVATPEVKETKIGFSGKNFSTIIKQIADAGYDGVELMPLHPDEFDQDQVINLLNSLGLEVPVIGTGLLFGVSGLTLLHEDVAIRNAAWDSYQRIVEFAASFKADLNIGSFRGWLPVDNNNNQIILGWHEMAVDILYKCAEYAGKYGLWLGVEPLNRYESNLINNTEEGLKFIKELKAENIGLVLDTFHMNIEEPTYEEAIKNAGKDIIHIHLGDSNRFPPGYGHIDFAKIVRTLKNVGYQSYLSGEMIPWPNTKTAIKETVKRMRTVINNLQDLNPRAK